MHACRIRDSFADSGIEYVLVYRIVVYGQMQGFQGFQHPFTDWGSRTACIWAFLTVKLGLSTASAHSLVLRPVLEAQKIRARAQGVPRVGKYGFMRNDQYISVPY